MGITYRLSISEIIGREGYEVRKSPAGKLIIRGKGISAWMTWSEFRSQFKNGGLLSI